MDIVSTQGKKVRTAAFFEDDATVGMIVKPEYIANRRASMDGVALSYVPGHGGDVWFVRHDIAGVPAVAVYCTDEFRIIEEG